jgi:hypothetical protein
VTVGRTTREQRPRERLALPGRQKPLKTEPQERYRGETNPEGVAGCKPSRACETPRTEDGGHGNSPREPNPRFRKRCRGRKPGRVPSDPQGSGVDPPVVPWRGARGYERRGRLLTFAIRGGLRNTVTPPKRIDGSVEAIPTLLSPPEPPSPRNPRRDSPAPARASWPQGWIRTAGESIVHPEGPTRQVTA